MPGSMIFSEKLRTPVKDAMLAGAFDKIAPALAVRSRRDAILLGGVMLSAAALSIAVAPGLAGLFGAALALLMLAISVVDARRFIIPNELVAAAALLGLLYTVVSEPDALRGVAAAALRAAALAILFLALREGY